MQNLPYGEEIVGTFESLVNSVRCKTNIPTIHLQYMFESLVNSVRCKTILVTVSMLGTFESLVNSVRCKTVGFIL